MLSSTVLVGAVCGAVLCATSVTSLPAKVEKRETDWAYFCTNSDGTDCGEGVAMSNSGCNLVEGGRQSLNYNQNAAEYYLGSFTAEGCGTLKTFYDINSGAVASVNQGRIQLNRDDIYYGFCSCNDCSDVTSGTGQCQ